jgi:hypothetical protein
LKPDLEKKFRYESGSKVGTLMKKKRRWKSRATVPLNLIWLVVGVNLSSFNLKLPEVKLYIKFSQSSLNAKELHLVWRFH